MPEMDKYTVGLEDDGCVHAGVSSISTRVACGADLFMVSVTELAKVNCPKCLAALKAVGVEVPDHA